MIKQFILEVTLKSGFYGVKTIVTAGGEEERPNRDDDRPDPGEVALDGQLVNLCYQCETYTVRNNDHSSVRVIEDVCKSRPGYLRVKIKLSPTYQALLPGARCSLCGSS